MQLKLNPFNSITLFDPGFVEAINTTLRDTREDTSSGVILNFRDAHYSAETGGYHPMELSIDLEGNLQYLTDFSYAGMPPYAELEKELDWDFTHNRFSQFGRDFDLECGRALLGLYTRNFTAYHDSGAYEVTVSSQFKQSIQST
jgi:hypothetical protein